MSLPPNAALPDVDAARDPLGVLATTRPVVAGARHVRIDAARVGETADDLAKNWNGPPAWEATLHYQDPGEPWKTAMWTLLLDALNFCFWPDGVASDRRWGVRYHGKRYDGYWGLAAALSRAVEEGAPLFDPAALAGISEAEVAHILRPDEERAGTPDIPLLDKRVAHIREVGAGLLRWQERQPGQPPVVTLIESAEGSGPALARQVIADFPSFNDVTTYHGKPVHLLKRAQILIADLAGTFEGQGLGEFLNLDELTVFADYKVPQVLRRFGILVYGDELAEWIARYEVIPAGSAAEVEIRAGTVWACELLRRAMASREITLHAFELDWTLWVAGQFLPGDAEPYHRTRTVFY
ncbi:MAG: queuosine 5'-phosphate N-glycosylase/hydrolase [Thermomicrobiales bacterium]